MGVNTKAIIRKGTTLEAIKEHLEKRYPVSQIESTHTDTFFQLPFSDGKDKRCLNIFFGQYALNDYGIDGVLLDLGCWGNAVDIMKYLLSEFGGYLDESDCDDKDFYPVNLEAFERGEEFTKEDLFRNKVIKELGYHNVNKAFDLFKEFKSL